MRYVACRQLCLYLSLLIACTGCAGPIRTPGSSAQRDVSHAVAANHQGLRHVEQGQFEQAERSFRQALEADLYYAPAHNNLGLVLLYQRKYYEAACQFEQAAKLAPHAAEPRANLGLLYEQVGRWPEAAEQYEQALSVEPDNFAVMGYLARTLIKTRNRSPRLKDLLERLVTAGDSPDWNEWARQELTRFGQLQDQ